MHLVLRWLSPAPAILSDQVLITVGILRTQKWGKSPSAVCKGIVQPQDGQHPDLLATQGRACHRKWGGSVGFRRRIRIELRTPATATKTPPITTNSVGMTVLLFLCLRLLALSVGVVAGSLLQKRYRPRTRSCASSPCGLPTSWPPLMNADLRHLSASVLMHLEYHRKIPIEDVQLLNRFSVLRKTTLWVGEVTQFLGPGVVTSEPLNNHEAAQNRLCTDIG